eukprot:3879743-Prymnesium_polylepis.1
MARVWRTMSTCDFHGGRYTRPYPASRWKIGGIAGPFGTVADGPTGESRLRGDRLRPGLRRSPSPQVGTRGP